MIIVLGIVLFLLMLGVGGDRGLTSFFALLINMVIMLISIALIVIGINPIVASLLCAVMLGITTLFYQNGINDKTITAFKSVVFVTVMLIIFASFICIKMKIAGLNELTINEDDTFYLSGDVHINMMMIAVPMIIIGLMGAITDTAIAVSSASYEVIRNNPGLSKKELFISGMNIGKSILGTTVNTLLFAMIGESLMMFNVMMNFEYDFFELVNSAAFSEVLACMVLSALGCVIIIPVTSYMFAYKRNT